MTSDLALIDNGKPLPAVLFFFSTYSEYRYKGIKPIFIKRKKEVCFILQSILGFPVSTSVEHPTSNLSGLNNNLSLFAMVLCNGWTQEQSLLGNQSDWGLFI